MLRLPVSEKKYSEVFIPSSYAQTCDPLEWGKFWAKGHHMNKLGRGALGKSTYQISKLHAFQFQRGRILKLVFFVPMSTTPMFHLGVPRRGQFWPKRHHMNKLGWSQQGDATYQISKLYAFHFQRRIWKFAVFVSIVNSWPGAGSVLTPGASYEQTW